MVAEDDEDAEEVVLCRMELKKEGDRAEKENQE